LSDFEPFEPAGVSVGLVAWQLHQPEKAIAPLIELARGQGLIDRMGVDERSGQTLWRLTDQGRERLRG
jgi:hypothetical protein